MSEQQAVEMAERVVDPRIATGGSECSCDGEGGSCREQLVSVDVLSGRTTPS